MWERVAALFYCPRCNIDPVVFCITDDVGSQPMSIMKPSLELCFVLELDPPHPLKYVGISKIRISL